MHDWEFAYKSVLSPCEDGLERTSDPTTGPHSLNGPPPLPTPGRQGLPRHAHALSADASSSWSRLNSGPRPPKVQPTTSTISEVTGVRHLL